MFSEECVMRVMKYNVDFTIPRLGRYGRIRLGRLCNIVLTLVALSASVFFWGPKFETSIPGVVFYILLTSFWILLVAFIVTEFKSEDVEAIYSSICNVDAVICPTISQQTDWILFLLASFSLSLTSSLVSLLLARGTQWYDIPFAVQMLIGFRLLTSVITKHLIAKRLRYIRSAEELMERVEETIASTCKLLECNRRLNDSFALLATSYSMLIFIRILLCHYMLWVFYGACIEMPYSPVNYTFPFAMVFCNSILSFLLIGSFCARISDEVDEIKLELDISLSARQCTAEQERLIFMFLMELQHTPVELSALGPFDINRSSISAACSIMISYLLVLIQYT